MSDSEEIARRAFAAEEMMPHSWSNHPGYRYPTHAHDYHKVLICVEGTITFHTSDGDVELIAGDRMDLPPGTAHSATVGPGGVTCMEAARR